MVSKEKVMEIIFKAVDDLNEFFPRQQRLKKAKETLLFAGLDSLGLVSLIVAVEQELLDKFKMEVVLADGEGVSAARNPFLTIETLADHILELLKEKIDV